MVVTMLRLSVFIRRLHIPENSLRAKFAASQAESLSRKSWPNIEYGISLNLFVGFNQHFKMAFIWFIYLALKRETMHSAHLVFGAA